MAMKSGCMKDRKMWRMACGGEVGAENWRPRVERNMRKDEWRVFDNDYTHEIEVRLSQILEKQVE